MLTFLRKVVKFVILWKFSFLIRKISFSLFFFLILFLLHLFLKEISIFLLL